LLHQLISFIARGRKLTAHVVHVCTWSLCDCLALVHSGTWELMLVFKVLVNHII
jgi:hypothetical protein